MIDRASERWQRLRASVCEFSPIDVDAHVDSVFRLVSKTGAGAAPNPLVEEGASVVVARGAAPRKPRRQK